MVQRRRVIAVQLHGAETEVTGGEVVLGALRQLVRRWRRRSCSSGGSAVDCLQMADKRDLLLASPELVGRLGYESKRLLKDALKSVERVRDLVAHSQSLDHDGWCVFFEGIAAAERFLDAAEGVVEGPTHIPPTTPQHLSP